jgi:Family of unknown function (DUF5719)
MADHDPHTAPRRDPGSPGGSGSTVAPRRGPARPLLALASLIPLAAAVGAVVMAPAPEETAFARAEAQAQPGTASLWCPGPVEVPDEALEGASDAELAITPPSTAVGLGTVALEPASSLLFGTVSGSETLQESDGSFRAPDITTKDPDGAVLEDTTTSADLGVGVQTLPEAETAPTVHAAASDGGRPVVDAVQSTATTSGDFRSLSLTRCAEPTTDASFLGVSTATGDSSVLVLRNPTDRPATASVQVWTEDGPAAMEGRSQVVVPPGGEEKVLLESVAGGHESVGVRTTVLGAPLSMHVQTTERDGLTPGGAEIAQPLAEESDDQVMPGVDVAGTPPVLVIANPQGSDTTAAVEVLGSEGPVDAAALEDLEVPAGAVVSVPLDGLPDGSYSVSLRSEDPVLAVTRSTVPGAELSGATVGTPVDFSLVSPAPALETSGVLALPAEGAAGYLTLTATSDTGVSVIPIAADGSAGSPVALEATEGTPLTVPAADLEVDGAAPSGVTVVPDVPGTVHAGWTQRESDGAGGTLVSSLPVPNARLGEESTTVRLRSE